MALNDNETPEVETDQDDIDLDDELAHDEDIELDIREAIEEETGGEATPVDDSKPVEAAKQPEEKPASETPAQQPGQKIDPPNTWNAEEKAWFNQQPLEAQKAFARRHQQMESHLHSVTREVSNLRREYTEIDEAIKPYERAWKLQGASRGTAIRALCEANAYLDDNLYEGLEYIARTKGYTLRQLVDAVETGSYTPDALPGEQVRGQNMSLAISPEMIQNTIRQELANFEANRSAAATRQQTLSEFHKVRDEKNEDGSYRWPELHDEAFVSELKPVFAGILEANPRLSPREQLLRAYQAQTGKPINSRPVAATNENRSSRATLSVRTGAPASRPKEGPIPDDVGDHIDQVAREYGWI